MVCPEAHRGHVQIGVLTGAEGPGASHADRDTKSIARQNLDIGTSTTLADIADKQARKTHRALCNPKRNDTIQHKLLWAVFEVNPYGSDSKRSTGNMTVQEDLVEGVAYR